MKFREFLGWEGRSRRDDFSLRSPIVTPCVPVN